MPTLAQTLHKTLDETRSWLNEFYDALDLDPSFKKRILDDDFSVIPNQNDVFKKKSSLWVEEELDEQLKNVLKVLNEDIRGKLVHSEVRTGDIEYNVYDLQELTDLLNASLQSSKIENALQYSACDMLVAMFSDNSEFPIARRQAIYEFSERLYPQTVGKKEKLDYYHPDLFKEADKIQIRAIIGNISEKKSIEALRKDLKFPKKKETLNWLNSFITFLFENGFESQMELKTQPILPNQNGIFTAKDNLNLDDGEIPNELKNISAALGSDFREKLLDTAIFLDLPPNRVTSASQVADEITRLITPRLAKIRRSDETRTIFRQLYQYFLKDPEKASDLFKDLYKNRHMLFGAEEIAASLAKGEEVDELLKEYDIEDIATLREILIHQKQAKATAPPEQEIINKETLAALGITSKDQLTKLIGEDPSSNIFRHTSISDPELYIYATSIIERTRANVIKHLKADPEYEFDEKNLDTIAPTVIGGIWKQGLPIHIVFRPSDNGQVLFYYPSEKATLDLANAELWIDDGITPPKQLTLGKILTTTGINRIPVK